MLRVAAGGHAALLTGDIEAPQEQAEPAGSVFICGACEEIVLTGCDTDELRDVVVKCRCGEFNQL